MPADAGLGPAGSRWRRRGRGGTQGTGGAPGGPAASGKSEANAPRSPPAARAGSLGERGGRATGRGGQGGSGRAGGWARSQAQAPRVSSGTDAPPRGAEWRRAGSGRKSPGAEVSRGRPGFVRAPAALKTPRGGGRGRSAGLWGGHAGLVPSPGVAGRPVSRPTTPGAGTPARGAGRGGERPGASRGRGGGMETRVRTRLRRRGAPLAPDLETRGRTSRPAVRTRAGLRGVRATRVETGRVRALPRGRRTGWRGLFLSAAAGERSSFPPEGTSLVAASRCAVWNLGSCRQTRPWLWGAGLGPRDPGRSHSLCATGRGLQRRESVWFEPLCVRI